MFQNRFDLWRLKYGEILGGHCSFWINYGQFS